MATSMIENTSSGIITDGFITNNPNVLIGTQTSYKVGSRLINSVLHIRVSADLPNYTSLVKTKDNIAWDNIRYRLFDTEGNAYERHPNHSIGVQTSSSGLVAGDYTLIIPC